MSTDYVVRWLTIRYSFICVASGMVGEVKLVAEELKAKDIARSLVKPQS